MTAATLQFILLALQEAPTLVTVAQVLIAELKGTATDEQNVQIDAALDAAHSALQNAQPST